MEFIDYVPEMGEYVLVEELRSLLEGKSLEEQMGNFVMTALHSAGMGLRYDCESPDPDLRCRCHSLEEDEYLSALIVDNGFIVGARINACSGPVNLFVNERGCVSVYYASDNNGAGYKEYEEYRYFVPLHRIFLE
ncbi:MAG: hypothetical protein E7Z67_00210 [Thermoplasmata archaeon]|nr:hypothetical protein [Thermoplasmata archaeon]